MKQAISICFLCLLVSTLIAQRSATDVLQSAVKKEINQYHAKDSLDKVNLIRYNLVEMPYADSYVIDSNVVHELENGSIQEVNLYYTDYPKGANLDQLNTDRIRNLAEFFPAILADSVTLNVIRQMDCSTRAEANQMFHGFEVITNVKKSKDLAYVHLRSNRVEPVVSAVMERHEWEDLLLIADLTNSMIPYVSQLMLWIKLNIKDNNIRQFVFFNDGNGRPARFKKIGATGGIHKSTSQNYEFIERMARAAISLCRSNFDVPENDVEGVLVGLHFCPDCSNVVLIADNNSDMRDYELIQKINRPIKVILCGVKDQINTEYLDLARATGGSVHTMEEDLEALTQLNEGDYFDIKGQRFQIVDGRFVKINL